MKIIVFRPEVESSYSDNTKLLLDAFENQELVHETVVDNRVIYVFKEKAT